jgi:flagellar hook protein FlgE
MVMGLYSALNASVSGMAAQTNTLTAISQNIANSNTTGYKDVEAQFEDVVTSASSNSFNGAGVLTNYAYLNSEQGGFGGTNTNTDLAINGNGFFMVQNSAGQQFLTRDGSFTPDASGNLVNDAGYTLLGYPPNYTGPANSTANLVPINVNGPASSNTPTTSGTFSANLPSTSTPMADTAAGNAAGATYTNKTSLVTYDNLGTPVTLDVYMTNTGADTWQIDVFNQADAAPGGGFPYGAPGLVTSQTLNFSGTTGALTSPSPGTMAIGIPNGQTLNLDISGMTQNAGAFGITTAHVNGSAPVAATRARDISSAGVVSAVYADGTEKPISIIQLATVPSPDHLTPVTGNVWQLNTETSGTLSLGAPGGTTGAGELKASTLELSTVDLATQLTNMIQAQSGYEANSKVFQTGNTLLQDLVNLLK